VLDNIIVCKSCEEVDALLPSRIKLSLIKHICELRCPGIFGSRVIDLEYILNCKKDITVSIDSGGWCYIKGKYKGKKTLHCNLERISGLQPLTIKQ
jgi:hypothetical protein